MFLANASIRRPIAMSCLIIALTLLGLNAWRAMPLELMPRIDLPFVTVVTVYPGASPEEIEAEVAKRIEDAMVSIDGLKHVTSSCMENVCQTFLEFQLGVDVDIAATDVREKLDLIRADFPEEVEDPKIRKFDLNAKPIVTLALTGDATLEELYDYADNTLGDRITVIRGVADVQLIGGAEREVHVELSRDRLAARGLTSMDVVRAIREGVRTIPSGHVREVGTEYSVKFDAEVRDAAAIGDLEIRNENGMRCHIRDVGRARMTTAEVRRWASLDGRPAVAIRVVKKADANAVKVTERVREAVGRLNAELPGGMKLVWVSDDGAFIRSTNRSAWLNVGQGILLTAAILFLFLYDLRALLIIGITMPLTIIVGLFFMQAAGFTLNTSTLIAVGLSVGILVTNSIVVLEAIVARIRKGAEPREAARLGAAESFTAVLASAGTNVVVLFPLSVMASKVGLFIRPLALTMFFMTLVSLFISFTLTPLLCSVLLRPVAAEERRSLLRRLEGGFNRGLDRLLGAYAGLLRFHERHRWSAVLVLLLVAGMLLSALTLAGRLGTSLVSDTDMGEVTVKLEFPTRYSLAQTIEGVREVEEKLTGLPGLRHVLSTAGKVEGVLGKSSVGVHLAQVLLKFPERTERKETIDDLTREVRARLKDIPGAIVTVLIPVPVGGQTTDVEMEISGRDLATLDRLAAKAAGLARDIPGMLDVDTTVRPGKPEVRITPRRPVLSDLGLPAVGLGLTMRANLEGITAGTFRREARSYDIVVKLAERQGRDQVEDFLLPGAPGRAIRLTGLARTEDRDVPVLITRKDKSRISMLYANLAPFLPLGTAAREIRRTIDENHILPRGYEVGFSGTYEAMEEGQAGLREAGILSLVLVFLALAAILESFKLPFLIFVTLPLAVIGVVWGLALAGLSLGIFEVMGAVMLIGIVVNNAILIIDRFQALVRGGEPRHGAMIAAARERFRPIVMISLAAVLGMLPLALGRGIGAELRNGVGLASAAGILVSGVLTPVVVPLLYGLVTRRNRAGEPSG